MADSSIDLVPVSNVKLVEPRATSLTAPPPYTAQPESTEYESLLELHERQEFTAVKPTPTSNADIDLEAAHPAASNVTAPPATAPAPKAPLTIKEIRALRVKPIDNIRALSLCLLLFQNAAIQAVSTHPNAAQLHVTSPKMFTFVNLFVGMTRLLVVPLLFFVSGFSTHFAMRVHDGSPIHFLIRKTRRTSFTGIFFVAAAYLSKRIRPLSLGEAGADVPYYASDEGIVALLNSPACYVLAILALDYIYAIFRIIVLVIYGHTTRTYFINTAKRYKIAKYTLFLSVEIYALAFSMIVGRLSLNPVLAEWMYALNSAELHFPLLYIGAYIAGLTFVGYFKFVLVTPPKSKRPGMSAGIVLFIRVFLSSLGLYLMYRNYPQSMPSFLDVRSKPALTLVPAGMQVLPEEGIDLLYGVWVGYSLLVIPEALLAAFWSIRWLTVPWGKFSRHAHILVYVQLVFVLGNKVPFLDNIFARWAYLGLMTIYFAYYIGVCGVIVGRLAMQGWNALRRRRRARADAEPEEGVISL